MKNQKPLNEGIFSSALKGLINKTSAKTERSKEIFASDFTKKLLSALQTGVKGGLIDPNAKMKDVNMNDAANFTPAPQQQKQDQQEEPKADTPPNKEFPDHKFKDRGTKLDMQEINDYYREVADKIKKTVGPNRKVALVKQMVNSLTRPEIQDSPLWQSSFSSIKKVLDYGGIDPRISKDALRNITQGRAINETVVKILGILLEKNEVSLEDLDMSLNYNGVRYLLIENATKHNLQTLLEEKLNEAAKRRSVGDYCWAYTSKFCQRDGIDYRTDMEVLVELCKDIEDAYPKVSPTIKKLGQAIYALAIEG